MKKIIAVFLSLAFSFGLFACNSVISANTCTLTLVQEGQKDVVLEVEKGTKPELPKPAQLNTQLKTAFVATINNHI